MIPHTGKPLPASQCILQATPRAQINNLVAQTSSIKTRTLPVSSGPLTPCLAVALIGMLVLPLLGPSLGWQDRRITPHVDPLWQTPAISNRNAFNK
jgi:hypothetical protein